MDRVRELDDRYRFMNAYAEGESHGEGVLRGYAVSVKDNVCVNGVESKAGSRILEGYVPPFDATGEEPRRGRLHHREDDPGRVRVRHIQRQHAIQDPAEPP
ncbi:MAG: amidase family protein [Candidatus Bathyarchaeota archaeon]